MSSVDRGRNLDFPRNEKLVVESLTLVSLFQLDIQTVDMWAFILNRVRINAASLAIHKPA